MRIGACLTALALTVGTAVGLVGPATAGTAQPTTVRPADLTTVSQNSLRDDWDPNEPGLSPATVTGGGFGQLFATPVDGRVYAQPLVLDGTSTPGTTVIAVTENDSVYSINGLTGAVNWHVQLGAPWLSSVANCGDLTPLVGITSTPVYDPSTGTLYVAAVVTGPAGQTATESTKTPQIELFALNVQTHVIESQTTIAGHPTNYGTMTFNAAWERQRPGLLLMNDTNGHPWVYMAFGSICDLGNYAGYVAGVDTTNQAQTLWTDEGGSSSADPQGGIWGSGGGLVSDGPGRIIVTSGNGISPPPGAGSTAPSELGDAVIRLNVQPGGSLRAGDFFSPANAPALAAGDRDLGSGAPIELPEGTSSNPDLIVQVGKDGRLFLLNGQNLGGRETGPGASDNPLSESGPYAGQWSHPGTFVDASGNEYVYYSGTGDDSSDFVRVLKLGTTSAGVPVLNEVGNSSVQFGYASGAPVVTSDGGDASSAIMWNVYTTGNSGADASLEAFDAVPRNGVLKQIWSMPLSVTSGTKTYPVASAKFAVVASDSGRLYVGTRGDSDGLAAGYVFGYGVTSQQPFLGAQPVTFPDAGVSGSSSSATVTLTATQNVTISSASLTAADTPSPFTMGTPSVNGTPVTSGLAGLALTTGQQLTIPLTFDPTTTGEATGSLVLSTTNATGAATTNISLAGTGTNPGLAVAPVTLAFGANSTGPNSTNYGPVPVGSSEPIQATLTNTGLTTETVTGVSGPAAPFTLAGPAKGTQLTPGESVVITGTYTPVSVSPATSPDTGSADIAYTDGTNTWTVTLNMTGVSEAGQGVLSPSVTSVNFGHVKLGATATATVDFTNTGNLPLTVTRFTAPGPPFGTPVPVATNLTLSPGDAIALPITYAPQSRGVNTGSYALTVTDGHNPARTVTVGVSGIADPAAHASVPSPGGGWTLNGSAVMKGTAVDLTQVVKGQAGSAVYYQPLPSSGLKATFTEQSSGGSGADGLTFGLVSPAAPGSVLGGNGQLLGFGGLHGVAVVVGTRKDTGFPSANFVGIATGTSNGHLVFAATSSAVPNMRSGPHVIGVSVSGTVVTVTVDGKQVLSKAVSLPATVLPVFTAGTGAEDDVHAVSAVSLSANYGAIPPPGGGWSYNGRAAVTGSDTRLTAALPYQAGTVIYPRAVSTAGFSAQFNMQIGGGTGANGMTFAFLKPGSSASAVGTDGSGLGLQGMTGAAVVFATYPNLGNSAHNFVSIVNATSSGLRPVATRVPVGQLTAGTHQVTITLNGSIITVYIDGGLVASARVTMTTTAMLAVTAGTGSITDAHIVRNAAIAISGW